MASEVVKCNAILGSDDVSDENSLCGLAANHASENLKDVSDENSLCELRVAANHASEDVRACINSLPYVWSRYKIKFSHVHLNNHPTITYIIIIIYIVPHSSHLYFQVYHFPVASESSTTATLEKGESYNYIHTRNSPRAQNAGGGRAMIILLKNTKEKTNPMLNAGDAACHPGYVTLVRVSSSLRPRRDSSCPRFHPTSSCSRQRLGW
jgi:hypothetical protein